MSQIFLTEFHRYRSVIDKTLSQVDDELLNASSGKDGNSIAMLVRHLSGNLTSRFTDFLTSDGEKPWRHRDREFEHRNYGREELLNMWNSAWEVVDNAIDSIKPDHLEQNVVIRGQQLTVHAALCRSVSHLAYHAGQIVLLARLSLDDRWVWISIPPGQSNQYNANPDMETSPDK